jgi:GTP pyrophosphokinase
MERPELVGGRWLESPDGGLFFDEANSRRLFRVADGKFSHVEFAKPAFRIRVNSAEISESDAMRMAPWAFGLPWRDKMELSTRFFEAIGYALELHNDQIRKGTKIPYIAHLLAVTALVLENGGDEDQAIAALLHDAVEDRGGLETLQEIHDKFGARVALIVKACSDAVSKPKAPWKKRKDAYIASIAEKPTDAVLVSIADKIHNARAILGDYREIGEALWERFKGGREGTLWYYRALVEAFKPVGPARMLAELERTVDELERLTVR